MGRNKDIYERVGVREYCVYDPKGGRHRPRLQLFRLAGGVYERVKWEGSLDGPLAVTSETLGLELRFEDDRMRLWDQQAGEYLLEPLEQHRALLEVRARRIAAERRAEQFERRADRLKREREESERRAERSVREADAAALARQKVEAEIAVVKEQMRRMR